MQNSYLPERFDLCVHDEVELAELAAPGVRTLDPLLQAGLVHVTQGAGAVAGGDEGEVGLPLAVADAAHVLQVAIATARRHCRRLGGVAPLHTRGGTQGFRHLKHIGKVSIRKLQNLTMHVYI